MVNSDILFSELLKENKIVPVVTVDSEQQAVSLAEALYAGGISVIEITLRTEAALAAIEAVKSAHTNITVLAGTVSTPEAMQAVQQAGADGAISPAFSIALLESARQVGIPFLPGVATPSEVLSGLEQGISEFKLFPAAAVGGIALLKSLAAPLSQAQFCPTGGLNMDNFTDYLNLPNVMCVGGSWMVPQQVLEQQQWQQITDLVKQSLSKL